MIDYKIKYTEGIMKSLTSILTSIKVRNVFKTMKQYVKNNPEMERAAGDLQSSVETLKRDLNKIKKNHPDLYAKYDDLLNMDDME